MSQNIHITCPVSPDRINENAARVAAFFVIALGFAGLAAHSWLVFFLLGLDFALRSFTAGDFSPIRLLSKLTTQALNLGQKPTDAAPKKFAAGVGLFFSFVIASFILFQFHSLALGFGAVLLVCAALEGLFGFCVGCVVYSTLVMPFLKNNSSQIQ